MADYLSIDRIENGVAVCENNSRAKIEIPLEKLPQGVKEGDCLRADGAGYVLDGDETERRRKLNLDLFRQLME